MKNILVTGGAGFIGSHTVVELVASGYSPVIVDNFSNSNPSVLERLKHITNKSIACEVLDIRDKSALERVFQTYDFEAVIHFAGFKAVGESIAKPLDYYHNNLVSTLILCELMVAYDVRQLVFSSSAVVYGAPQFMPITEDFLLHATNPYGWTKVMIEQMLDDVATAAMDMRIIKLRYFNPIGAHESGLIGEDPTDIPNNLLPYVSKVAGGKLKRVRVFGSDYNTPDGTGIRDYIHVVDLARGHIAALNHLPGPGSSVAYNLGTGQGASVLEVIKAFEKASGKPIPYDLVDRRPGDVAICYADTTKANRELNWQAKRTLDDACRDAWKWQLRANEAPST